MNTPRIAIVGSGAAGLMAAIAASSSASCVLLTDGALGRSNSMMAQGGLQLPLPDDESKRRFIGDILRSARTDLDARMVKNFVEHVHDTIYMLEDWGLGLDRDERGVLVRRSAGGLSDPRIVSVRDQIGPALIKLLRARVQQCDLEIRQHVRVIGIRRQKPASWILTLQQEGGDEDELEVPCVIVCTGGVTWREAQRRHQPTTNPRNDNHVLFDQLTAMGLPVVHYDFYQYQPFGIVDTAGGELGRCVPESIVNFGVQLLDRERAPIGDIRQDRYALTQLMFNLSRGRAVESEHGPGFWLTVGDVPESTLATVFPKVHQYLERHGGVGSDVLVYPFLHYYLGGLRIDTRCSTDLPGLFLAGEITGGLHGRNRLMGNGITDSLVHGRLAGLHAAEYARGEA